MINSKFDLFSRENCQFLPFLCSPVAINEVLGDRFGTSRVFCFYGIHTNSRIILCQDLFHCAIISI